jgi:hypothetical protein
MEYGGFDEGVPVPAFGAAAKPLGFLVAAGGTFKNKRFLFFHDPV